MVQVRVPDGTNEWEIARTLEAMPGVESAGLNLEVRFGPLLELETPENSSAAVATPAAWRRSWQRGRGFFPVSWRLGLVDRGDRFRPSLVDFYGFDVG